MSLSVEHLRAILVWPLRVEGFDPGRVTEPWRRCNDPYRAIPGQEEEARYAQFVYFHPFVREILFGKDSCDVFEHETVKALRIELNTYATQQTFVLDVRRCSLYVFGDVLFLTVEVASRTPLALTAAEDLLDTVRRSYQPYWEKDGKGGYRACHCPQSVAWLDAGDAVPAGASTQFGAPLHGPSLNCVADPDSRQPPVAPHWAWILKPFHFEGTGALRLSHLIDERIPTMAFVAAEAPAALSEGDFVRLGYLDEAGRSETLPYSTAILKDFWTRSAYDRFWDPLTQGHGWMQTRYFSMGYSFVVVGSSHDQSFYMNPDTGALAHFQGHYFYMYLLAQLHYAKLLVFSKRLAEEIQGQENFKTSPIDYADNLQKLRIEYADFVSRYWFDEVSSHLQARELFHLIRTNLGTLSLYREVTDEIGSVADVVSGAEQTKLTRAQTRLTGAQTALSKFAAEAALLGLIVLLATLPPLASAFEYWLKSLQLPVPTWSFYAIGGVVLVTVYLWRWLHYQKWWKRVD